MTVCPPPPPFGPPPLKLNTQLRHWCVCPLLLIRTSSPCNGCSLSSEWSVIIYPLIRVERPFTHLQSRTREHAHAHAHTLLPIYKTKYLFFTLKYPRNRIHCNFKKDKKQTKKQQKINKINVASGGADPLSNLPCYCGSTTIKL